MNSGEPIDRSARFANTLNQSQFAVGQLLSSSGESRTVRHGLADARLEERGDVLFRLLILVLTSARSVARARRDLSVDREDMAGCTSRRKTTKSNYHPTCSRPLPPRCNTQYPKRHSTHIVKHIRLERDSEAQRTHLHHPLVFRPRLAPVFLAPWVCAVFEPLDPSVHSRIIISSHQKTCQTPKRPGERLEIDCPKVVVRRGVADIDERSPGGGMGPERVENWYQMGCS